MTTEELIERLNKNERVIARRKEGKVVVCNDCGDPVVAIDDQATNIFELDWRSCTPYINFGESSREYITAQIEEYLQTPIEKRKPEKKYNLYLGFIAGTRDTEYWLMKPAFPNDTTPFQLARDRKNPRKIWTENEVDKLKRKLPIMAEAIEKMKVPVPVKEDD